MYVITHRYSVQKSDIRQLCSFMSIPSTVNIVNQLKANEYAVNSSKTTVIADDRQIKEKPELLKVGVTSLEENINEN